MVDENTLGREPITIVEIDQDFCSLTYGSAPCTASLGVTGSSKCYNTLTTCQDTANYDLSTLTLRFCSQSRSFPSPSEPELYLPIVESVSTNPTQINIANGNRDMQPLGKRSSVTIVMRDIPYDDARVDKYLTDRGFDPLTRSSFWVKFLKRNLYYQNRPLRVREGYIGQAVGDMRTRHYIIDKISGVDSNGRVRIVAKDILKLAEDKRAQAPVASPGVLLAAITNVAVSATLSPTGIGNSDYPASGKVAIGKEIISFTRSGDVLTLTRAQNNTEAAAHGAGDTVQLCFVVTNERVEAAINTLLVDYGNIDSSYVPLTDWEEEADTWLNDAIINAVVTKPTGVSELVGELCEQGGCFIWWDDVAQEIKFRASRPASKASIVDIDSDSNIVAESVSIDRAPDDRLSQVWIYYDQVDPTQGTDDASNFNLLRISADLNAEDITQYGESRVRKIFSRWLNSTGASQTSVLGSRILTACRDNPVYITCALDAKDRSLDIADVVRFTHRSLVDFEGNELATLLQVISRQEVESGHKIVYKFQLFGFLGNFGNIMPNGSVDFTSATQLEKDTGWYISNNAGKMSDGSDGYKIA